MKRVLLAAGLCALGSPPAAAKTEVPTADCGAKPPADRTLEMKIGDQVLALPVATFHKQQELGSGDEQFEVFALSLRDDASIFAPHEFAISVLVKSGTRVDGKAFRMLPDADQKKQPTPVTAEGVWLPEVQSWELRSDPDSIDYKFFGALASARIEFGKRSGDSLPGRVVFCIAPGQKDETLQPEPTRPVLVEGRFEAKLE